MLFAVANRQQSAMYGGVQRFDASIQNFREPRYFGDADNRHALLFEQRLRAACRNDLHAQFGEFAGKLHNAGFVRDAD